MTTYLLITSDKPKELTAFVGPKEPTQAEFNWGFAREHSDWKSSIETAKASRLPVVNVEAAGFHFESGKLIKFNSDETSYRTVEPGEIVPLEGWEPEIVYQAFDDDIKKWIEVTELFYNGPIVCTKRQAYRLKRSEPVKEDSYSSKKSNLIDRAKWIAYCIEIGFATKDQIPKLEEIWDRFKNPSPIEAKTQDFDQFNLPAAAVFQIQMIALADDDMVSRPGAAESYRAIARHLLELFKKTPESHKTQESQEDRINVLKLVQLFQLHNEDLNKAADEVLKEWILTLRNP